MAKIELNMEALKAGRIHTGCENVNPDDWNDFSRYLRERFEREMGSLKYKYLVLDLIQPKVEMCIKRMYDDITENCRRRHSQGIKFFDEETGEESTYWPFVHGDIEVECVRPKIEYDDENYLYNYYVYDPEKIYLGFWTSYVPTEAETMVYIKTSRDVKLMFKAIGLKGFKFE